jgi:hypothetical protein
VSAATVTVARKVVVTRIGRHLTLVAMVGLGGFGELLSAPLPIAHQFEEGAAEPPRVPPGAIRIVNFDRHDIAVVSRLQRSLFKNLKNKEKNDKIKFYLGMRVVIAS